MSLKSVSESHPMELKYNVYSSVFRNQSSLKQSKQIWNYSHEMFSNSSAKAQRMIRHEKC